MRQQHLRRAQVMLAETGLIDLSQSHLAHRSAGLQLVNAGRPPVETKPLHAFCNRTGADEDSFLAHCAQLCNLLCPFRNGRMVQPLAIVCDERRTNLDDDAFGFLNDGIHDGRITAICLFLDMLAMVAMFHVIGLRACQG